MTDEQNTPKQSRRSKPLIITVLVGLIILIAWLSIQIVSIAPAAFTSLASLAEGLNQYSASTETTEPADTKVLTVTSNKTLVNSGEALTLTWDTATIAGSYTFSYTCTDGVALDLLEADSGLRAIACNTNYNIGKVSSLLVSVSSEKERFETVDYTVAFLATNDTTPRASGHASFTVVNDSIPAITVAEEVEPTPEPVEVVTTPETTTPETGTGTSYEFTYTIPVSDPAGRTDLGTRFLASGTIVVDTFFSGEIVQGEAGAIQFEVKNYGTKTSTEWTYSVTLPTGSIYTSAVQAPLKPNERAAIVIGFPTAEKTQHAFTVTIDETSDQNNLNDTFTQTVSFVK